MADWGVTVKGVGSVIKLLQNTRDKVRDLTPVFEDIVKDFAKYEMQVFAREGAVRGWVRWTPLNPVYAAAKRAAGFRSKILVREGHLKGSLTNPSDPNFRTRISPYGT